MQACLRRGVCPKTIGVCPGFARGLPRGLPNGYTPWEWEFTLAWHMPSRALARHMPLQALRHGTIQLYRTTAHMPSLALAWHMPLQTARRASKEIYCTPIRTRARLRLHLLGTSHRRQCDVVQGDSIVRPLHTRARLCARPSELKSKAFMLTYNPQEFSANTWPAFKQHVEDMRSRFGSRAFACCIEESSLNCKISKDIFCNSSLI